MAADATLTRSPRAEQTRARIITAARDVFVAQGYRAASLRDIAAAAGLSHPGLLKHFTSKELLLAEVVDAFERANESAFLDESATLAAGSLIYASVAQRNEGIPGYLPLYAALVGEGTAAGHPAHGRMGERYADLREMLTDGLADAVDHGLVDPERDPSTESVRLAAIWDGLQLLRLYLPERVQLVDLLREHQEQLALPPGWSGGGGAGDSTRPHSAIPPMADLDSEEGAREEGYRIGRQRRAQIIADATELFARDGYADTSLREIAERVGLSKSALLHHYPSKDALLSAVLTEHDRRMTAVLDAEAEHASAVLRALAAGAAAGARAEPGLIEVYAVLSCEALPADHAAHAYFRDRFVTVLDRFTGILRAAQADGDLPAHRDPEREAIRLVALWDGLQYQWLYDREAIDVASHLEAHLADILPPR